MSDQKMKKFVIFDHYSYQDYPQDLDCKMCANPVIDPVQHIKCNQMFCESCVKNKACPICKGFSTFNSENIIPVTVKYVENALKNIKVQCDKCKEIVKRDDFDHHVWHYCTKQYKCQSCKHPMEESEQEEHNKICEHQLEICSGRDIGCDWMNKSFMLENHEEKCEYLQTKSILMKFGLISEDQKVLPSEAVET